MCAVRKTAMRTVLVIMGMHDNLCRERVADALRSVAGVDDVSVSLMRARATVDHQPACEPSALVWAVVNAGFGAAMDVALLPSGSGEGE
jgi:copper chaperone CopZ